MTFQENTEDFIIDSSGNFYTFLQSCFYLELHIDEGCVIAVFSVLYMPPGVVASREVVMSFDEVLAVVAEFSFSGLGSPFSKFVFIAKSVVDHGGTTM